MTGWAVVDGQLCTEVVDATSDPTALNGSGFWVVVMTFEGDLRCVRFGRREPLGSWYAEAPPWHPPSREDWRTSLTQADYEARVQQIRTRIAAGDVYQVNLCRLLTRDMAPDVRALAAALARGNPAPYSMAIDLPDERLHIASASPELSIRRNGGTICSGPIKGTAPIDSGLTAKDIAENVMIVDLVRNDLSRVAETGSVMVSKLLERQRHPGLVHLVSTVEAELRDNLGWSEILAATMPAGSVSGAPKSAALDVIADLEPEPRGAYCGALGWIDADQAVGELAVGIRTYEWRHGRLQLGTGAGITWGSDPAGEWEETELKVSRLLAVR